MRRTRENLVADRFTYKRNVCEASCKDDHVNLITKEDEHGYAYETKLYTYRNSSNVDMGTIGGTALRIYFGQLRMFAFVFLMVGLVSLVPIAANV